MLSLYNSFLYFNLYERVLFIHQKNKNPPYLRLAVKV